jgi:hypothetical protein
MFFLLENVTLIARIFTLLKRARNPLLTFYNVQAWCLLGSDISDEEEQDMNSNIVTS